jgi:AP-1 complex subunit gamma-1
MCIEKYAPSRKWHIDTVIKVLTLAGNHTKEEFISYLIHLISATPELQPYAVHRSFFSLKENLHQEGLVLLGVWLIGEFGEHLLQGKMVASDETPITVTEDELCDLLEIILDNPKASNKFREYTLTALVKLSVKIEGVAQRIQGLIDSQTTIDAMEVQQRACEYSQILDKRWDTQRLPSIYFIFLLEKAFLIQSL